jgi:hypothetical protein
MIKEAQLQAAMNQGQTWAFEDMQWSRAWSALRLQVQEFAIVRILGVQCRSLRDFRCSGVCNTGTVCDRQHKCHLVHRCRTSLG